MGTVIAPLQWGHFPCLPAALSLRVSGALHVGQSKTMGLAVTPRNLFRVREPSRTTILLSRNCPRNDEATLAFPKPAAGQQAGRAVRVVHFRTGRYDYLFDRKRPHFRRVSFQRKKQ